MTMVLGSPVTRSRPLISADSSSSSLKALPSSILSCSAVWVPMASLYSFWMYVPMASSMSSPAILIEDLVTMPPSEITATSLVPPPTSTIMDPCASLTGSPAPIAAASGSSMVYACRAPADSVASLTARSSTPVTPEGTQTTTRGPIEGAEDPALRLDLADKVGEHLLRYLEVGDDAVLERPVARRCCRAYARACAWRRDPRRRPCRSCCLWRRPKARRARSPAP